MNKLTFAVSLTVAAGLGFFVGKNHNPTEIVASPAFVAEQEQIKAPLIAQDTLVTPERNFRADNLATATDTPTPLAISVDDTKHLTAQEQIDGVKAEYELKERSEKFTEWLTKNQKEKPKPQQGKISPEQIKQLLESLQNEEKKTQQKMNAQKAKGDKLKQEKDW